MTPKKLQKIELVGESSLPDVLKGTDSKSYSYSTGPVHTTDNGDSRACWYFFHIWWFVTDNVVLCLLQKLNDNID